jgi:Co/Zn/Cd efflux system component
MTLNVGFAIIKACYDWVTGSLSSLIIVFVVIIGTWSLFRQSLRLLLDGVSKHITLQIEAEACAAACAPDSDHP